MSGGGDQKISILIDWRDVRRHWSLWLGAAGCVFSAVAQFIPGALQMLSSLWQGMPPGILPFLTAKSVGTIGIALWMASLAAKFLSQQGVKSWLVKVVEKVKRLLPVVSPPQS